MRKITFLITILIFTSCSCNDSQEIEGCNTSSDCKTEEVCNLYNKCEEKFIPKWTYQSEVFDEIKTPYLFTNKYIEEVNSESHIKSEIRIVDLEKREYIKNISFPYNAEGPFFKNPKNSKFYFFNLPDTATPTDEPYGLIEIDPKTGLISLVSNDFNITDLSGISNNGKIYSLTSKPCRNADFSDIMMGTKIHVFDTNIYKGKTICAPSVISRVHKNINGMFYTQGYYSNDSLIYEINPDNDEIKNILPKTNNYGGWTLITAIEKEYIYFRANTPYKELSRVSIETSEIGNFPINLSIATDGMEQHSTFGSFNIKNELFIFTYNQHQNYSHLVKVNTDTLEHTWLYSHILNPYQSYYEPNGNIVILREGILFFVDDYEIKQFRGDDYKMEEAIKKF